MGAAVVDQVGAMCWNELATTDVDRAKRFFAELVGSTLRDRRRPLHDDRESGETHRESAAKRRLGRAASRRGSPTSWLSADDTIRKAEELGGRPCGAEH